MEIITIDFLRVQVGLFTNREDLVSVAESKGITDLSEDARSQGLNGLAIKSFGADGLPYFFLAVFNKDMGTLLHECVHMADYLMSSHGMPTGEENTELRAYLTEYLFRESMKLGRFKL